MIHSIRHESIVETLLNSLEAERYLRGPLLLNVIDELASIDTFSRAAEFARRMFEAYEGGTIEDGDFIARVQELRGLVRMLSRPPSLRPPISDAHSRAPASGTVSDTKPAGLLGAA
jgi:hypothetical protein